MAKKIYTQKKTFEKYDDKHYLLYLNEEVIEGYVPETMEGEEKEPVTAYQYEGPEIDGGTMVEATASDRDSLINGLLRTRYSQTAEDAIKTHQIEVLTDSENPKAEEYRAEWEEFNAFRKSAITSVDSILA